MIIEVTFENLEDEREAPDDPRAAEGELSELIAEALAPWGPVKEVRIEGLPGA